MPITWQQSNLARVLLQVPGTRTIEDLARKVIQLLWLEVLTELTQVGESTLNYGQVAERLAGRVGCGDAHQKGEAEPVSAVGLQSAPMVSNLHPLLQEVPLFTPLLGEERFVVMQFLDLLRRDQWLKRAESH